jgi:protein SCO1
MASKPPAARFAGTPVPGNMSAQDFALHDQDGKLVRLSAQRGQLVLLAFLYTNCRDICPLIAEHLDTAARALGPAGRAVHILAVSVDPDGDTPVTVHKYVRVHRLAARFRWLLGTRDELAPVWRDWNILVEARNPELIAHGAPIYLIDRQGRVRLAYGQSVPAADVEHDLRLLLRGAAPAPSGS